jgi:hypothetical protein
VTKAPATESNSSMKRTVITKAVLPIALLSAIGIFGITWAQNVRGPIKGSGNAAITTADLSALTATNNAPKPRPLAYYTSGIRSDLFTVTDTGAATAPKKKETAKLPTPIVDVVTPMPPPNPLADYVYTGTVTANGHRYALLENSKTREGHFVSDGDSLLGGTVGEISDRGLTVTIAGAPQMIAKTENYKLTPFDKSAPYLQGGEGGANGGGTQMAGGVPGMPTFGGPQQAMMGMRGMQGRFGGMGGGGPMQMRMGGPGGGPAMMGGQNAVMQIKGFDASNGATFAVDKLSVMDAPAAPAPTVTFEVVK